ncbi:ABC transporter substrate-binding protein [Nocardia sp. NPDC004722]
MLRNSRIRATLVALCVAAVATGCAGRAPTATPPANDTGALLNLSPTTPAAAHGVDSATWALYRNPTTVDPAMAFDYPENTVVATMCDALLRQKPDGSVDFGLASDYRYQSPTSLALTIRKGVTFWDGKPLTVDDVVYSLNRHRDPSLGGFYGTVFDRVDKITAQGPDQVVITLTQPDYWLPGELSAMPGIVVEKSFAEQAGAKFGTPEGGTMCTGAYQLSKWTAGDTLKVTANPHYWDTGLKPLTKELTFRGISDAATLTTGLTTGEIDGSYVTDTSNVNQLQHIGTVSVKLGPTLESEFFIPAKLTGVLGDVRVRRALSMAFDRRSFISAVYAGNALEPRTSTNPGTWGYAKDTFTAAWNAAPEVKRDLDEAKRLIQEAGATGKPLVIGTSSGMATVATMSNAWLEVANAIGLHATLYNVSPENYINFFTDPKAREGVDAFSTTTYGDYADPAALISTYVLPNHNQNYSGYENPALTDWLNKARAEADPARRAADVVEADKIVMSDLPWIPVAHPVTFLALSKKLTGIPTSFSYMQSPALAMLGAAGS